MDQREFINFMHILEKQKCNTRHSWTSSSRHESVAEHTCRMACMALLLGDEYPVLDMNKVIKMCLVHDWGEAVTGDIPAFDKTADDDAVEDEAIAYLLSLLPDKTRAELSALFSEMAVLESDEAKLYKALDNLEALISHNEAPLSTWTLLEHELNLTYGQENCECSDWTKALREEIRRDSLEKLKKVCVNADK